MKIAFPHMGTLTTSMKSVFTKLDQEFIVPPPISGKTVQLGVKHSPELVCLPFKITLGNMIEALELGADTVVTATSCGNCRLGFYWPAQEIILKELGYKFKMMAINYDNPLGFMAEFKKFGGGKSWLKVFNALLFGVKKQRVLESLEKEAMRIRPLERRRGDTDRILRSAFERVDLASTKKELAHSKEASLSEFQRIEKSPGREPLRVMIVGETYMIVEPNVNFNLMAKLGDLGIHAERSYWLGERILRALRLSPDGRRHHEMAKTYAYPYMRYPELCTGALSIGETIAAKKDGFDGVILVMPFTCMPEVLSQSLMMKVSAEHSIPVLTVILDEHSDDGALLTRLEAFRDLLETKKRRSCATRGYFLKEASNLTMNSLPLSD
ncbi:MAG: CoA protein activase [Candidatus Eisenbacteria bacterium]|nr:CoA protein activase [Candidatus Eisenbacteria bacterium]